MSDEIIINIDNEVDNILPINYNDIVHTNINLSTPTYDVKYHFDDMPKFKSHHTVEDWVDVCVCDVISKRGGLVEYDEESSSWSYHEGSHLMINLGFSLNSGGDYDRILVPRSSTFKRYGLIQTNSIGVIDASYCGDGDVWYMSMWSMFPSTIKKYSRIGQFRLIHKMHGFEFNDVGSLGDHDSRGGFGSTGV